MPFLILGEPLLGPDSPDKIPRPLMAPHGQLELCMSIHQAFPNNADVIAGLREEYLAIAHALKMQLRLDFRIAHVVEKPTLADTRVLSALQGLLDCKFVGFTKDCNRELTTYPCDFGVALPGINLLNRRYGSLVSEDTKGELSVVSPYGEAGRILYAGKKVVVAERICRGDSSEPAQTERLKQVGLSVGLLPNPLSGTVEGKYLLTSTNDHLDRVAAMVLGRDGQPHLVIEPQYWGGPAKNPTKPPATREKIKRVCGELGVELRVPKAACLKMPYSLNLVQLTDGRVLMTCGDEPVAETVEGIVGKENLFLTEVPIFLYPAFRFAGIRCLIGQTPSVFFKKRDGSDLGGNA